MAIKAIACIGANGVMGLQGTMPWGDRPLDGPFFRSQTMGHMVLMGGNTFRSMNYMPLAGRDNIILSRRIMTSLGQSTSCFTVQEALAYYHMKAKPGQDLWVIGGAKTYEEMLPSIEEFYVTTVGESFPGDVYMPDMFKSYKWEYELLGSDKSSYGDYDLFYRRFYNKQAKREEDEKGAFHSWRT